MQTTGVSNNVLTDKYGYGSSSAVNSGNGDQNMFLQILTTQLKNQDPTSPMDNAEMIQQLTSLSQIQESASLNKKLGSLLSLQEIVAGQNAFTQSAALVGKNVKFVDPTSEKEMSGLVSEINLKDGALTLSINGKDVPMSSIIGITSAENASNSTATDSESSSADDTATESDNA